MKSAFIEAVRAFTNQVKANYNEHVIREYNRITKSQKPAKK